MYNNILTVTENNYVILDKIQFYQVNTKQKKSKVKFDIHVRIKAQIKTSSHVISCLFPENNDKL